MERTSRRLATVLGVILIIPSAGSAQSRQLPDPPPCTPMATAIVMQVKNASGAAMAGTTVEMIRARDTTSLGFAKEMRAGKGEFLLIESADASWVTEKGDTVHLIVRAGGHVVKEDIVIAKDAKGCSLIKKSGPSVIVVK